MNFINQITIFLLFNLYIFITMQNDIAFNLDKEYTNLMLLSNFDSVKLPEIEEEQINLERRMQFRLIAWNFAEKYGLENEKKKIARNKKGEIKDMVKYACELWTKTALKEEIEQAKKIEENPELAHKTRKAFLKQLKEKPMSLADMVKRDQGDCDHLEFQLDDKSDPFEEMPIWVSNFFDAANELHFEAMKKLLSGKKLDEDNFEFWWTKFQKRMQELRDEEQLKKALELEDVEAKMGRSKAIVPFNVNKKKSIPLEEGNVNEESQFLREMRKFVINSITKDGQEELKLVKRQIIKMTSANTLIDLEEFFPTLLGIGTIEELEALGFYKYIMNDMNEAEFALWEFRISGAYFYDRIWRKLFDQLFEKEENEENVRAHLKQLFQISKKFNIFTISTNIDKYDAEKMCLELLELWMKIMGVNEDYDKKKEIKENFEEYRMEIRKKLLWKEHWAWLDLLKNMDKQLLDSNFSPGNIYKFSEFFGGFEQIWSKIIEMEKSGQKSLQLDRDVDAENMNYSRENFMDKMLAPFRTKLNDFRLIYNIQDYFEKIVLLQSKGDLNIRKMMWKTTIDIKRCIWGLDLLIWMQILDEQIDQISNENNNEQLVNAWWNARVEIEIFHDSLAIRAGGYEGVEKPALYMLNWMYLLTHQKCITRNNAGKNHKEKFEDNLKEENRNEMNNNLISYIEKCKKLAKKYTEKERKHYDEDEIRKKRWDYITKLINEGERFYAEYIANDLAEQIEDQETLTKLEELIGSKFLAELTAKYSKNIGRRYLVEKWIEIFQIPDKKIRFKASLDVMYLRAKKIISNIKYSAQKHQIILISSQREHARKLYDGITRIEQQVANVLGMEEKELVGDNIPTTSRTKNIEISTDELSRQINIIRSIKMLRDFCAMLAEEQSSNFINTYNYNDIQMLTSEFVQANFNRIMEELRNFHMKGLDFKQFARVLQSDPKLVQFLRNEVGAVYELNTLLSWGYDGEKQKLNYETLWNEINEDPNVMIGDKEEKAKRRNIEIVWEETSKGANSVGNNLENPLRDIDFFNDKRLVENYVLAFKNYKLDGENSPTKMYSLAANILVFMQYFEKFVMRPTRLPTKLRLIRAKYGEKIRLFARIEYDKVLTDFGEVKFNVQRELFARLLSKINSRSKKEIISEILHNYRLEKIVVENENDKIFEYYDENIQKLHTEEFVRLLRQEKWEEEKNKGKKEGEKFSIVKLLKDANSEHGKRQILFNFIGDFERIVSIFNEIGPRGIKIKAEDYAHFVKGKEIVEEMESRIEQPFIELPEPLTEAENLAAAEMTAEIIELTMKEIGKSDTNENSKEMEAEFVESPNHAPVSFMSPLSSLYNYIPSLNKVKEEKDQNMNKQIGENGPKKGITKFFIFSGQNKPENRKYVTKVEIFPMKKNEDGKLEENKPKNWTTESKCDGEILNQNKVKGKFIVDWGKCGLTNEFWNSSEMAVLQMLISIREPNSTSENSQYTVNFSMDLKINTELNDKDEQREKLRKLLEGRHLIEIDVTKREKSKSETQNKEKVTEEMESQNEQLLRITIPESLVEAKNLDTPQVVFAERQEPPADLLRRKPQAYEAPKREKKSWADMASDSDDSDSDKGKEERKNVQIEQIVQGGNDLQKIEEIKDNKESAKEVKRENLMTQGATSSKKPKGKKKKKDRFQITKEEASSNFPLPPIDVASGDNNTQIGSKSQKKREKKKLKRAEKEYGKVKILKRDEKEEEEEEMIDLPSNEIVEGKFYDHKLPAFKKYLNDQFLYNKFLEIYEKFIAEQKWSPEEHLFLTIGTYLNETNQKLKALEGIKQGKIFLPNSIDWKMVEEMQRELNELNLMEEKKWKLKELNELMEKLHGIFIKLLGQIDGYSIEDGKSKENEVEKEKDLYDQSYLRLQLNWICFARAICEEKKLEQIWSVKSITRQTYNRDFVVLIGQKPIIVVEQGQKNNQHKINSLEKLSTQFEKEYLIPYKQMLEQNAIDRQLLNEYWPNNSAANYAITIEFNKLTQLFRWNSEQIRQARGSTQKIREVVYNVVVNDDEDEAKESNNRRLYEHINFAIQRIKYIITTIWSPQSTLKIAGSYQLGTWTPNSDINAILIASKRVGSARFFGKSKSCESNRWCLDIDSLFCQLCQNKNVFHLVKYPNNHIPHMKFTYCTHFERHQMDFDRSKLPAYQCTPIELVLVSMPGYGIISEKTLQNTQLLIDQFREKGEEDIYEINWDDSRAGMIHALSGYQLNEYILLKLVNKNMLRVFRICLVALKKWAENNHIYGGQYGLLNGASLSLMLLKIVLRFPITPMVPFILEQFFVQFVNWPWPMPVQFAPLGADKTEASEKKLGWQADREKGQKQKMLQSKVRHVEGWHLLPTLNMPIISPCKPERNVAYSVNHSTQQIIQRQLKLGLEMIEKIREQQHKQNLYAISEHHINANKYSWKSLLNDKKSFGEKYTHYIVFYCFAKTSSSFEQRDLGEQFCDEYVLYQLRLQLIFSVERNPNTGISRCHILPNMDMGKQQKKNLRELSKRLMAVPPEFRRNSLNRYWVIGLEFADKRDGNYVAAEQLENWLKESQFGFVEKFIQDYFIFSMRKHSKAEIYKKLANIHLYAKFVPAEQLGQWTIGSQILRPKEQKELN